MDIKDIDRQMYRTVVKKCSRIIKGERFKREVFTSSSAIQ